MKNTVKVGYIGLGRRGMAMLEKCFSEMKDVEVTYLCDVDDEKMQKGKNLLEEKGKVTPKLTENYLDILN
ncbi:MAG: hypothetical protein IIW20_03765, partial [Clostridia bacterium]|nr:hypothetical protein [Clostridia bacterium]